MKLKNNMSIHKMSKALNWENDAKCYVLCEYVKTWYGGKRSWYIRPCDMDADELRTLWKSTKGCSVMFGGCILRANDDESEEEFILRATIAGKGPDFKDICDDKHNTIDFIDLTTGKSLDLGLTTSKSLDKQRERMLKAKSAKQIIAKKKRHSNV